MFKDMKGKNMKYKIYEEHLAKWNRARETVSKHNEKLIEQWRSIPWWQFWNKPSFETQRSIIMENWNEFNKLPAPKLMDYFPINLCSKI